VSCLRENLTSSSYGEGLETGRDSSVPRQSFTRQVFFKQIKQTLQIGDFLGHNRNAIEWQLWTALLMYVLLRFLHARSRWPHSFTRLFTCLRAVLWQARELQAYLRSYGTAGGSLRLQWAPQQAFLPGFS
jgi:hypothetical protein